MLQAKRQNLSSRLPFVAVHLGALMVFYTGFSWPALWVCIALYFIRMFGITAGFHRYFSHRSFKTSRVFHTILALLGTSAAQTGPIWWAAHHRHHHQHSDTDNDVHSPTTDSFWWAHVGWLLDKDSLKTDKKRVKDLLSYPEIRWIDRYHYLVPATLVALLFISGQTIQLMNPASGTTGMQMVAWGFFLSTVLLYHGTFAVNSICHRFGSQPYTTEDQSRNNLWVALLSLGEGWHNNHHRFPGSEKHGHHWWQLDITHMVLKALSLLGIVWQLKEPPSTALSLSKIV